MYDDEEKNNDELEEVLDDENEDELTEEAEQSEDISDEPSYTNLNRNRMPHRTVAGSVPKSRENNTTPENISRNAHSRVKRPTQRSNNLANDNNSFGSTSFRPQNILNIGRDNNELKEKATIIKTLKNPIVRKIILIAIPVVLIILVILFVAASLSMDDSGKIIGKYRYYSAGACRYVKYEDKIMNLEDYIGNVLTSEIEDIAYSPETLKTLAVAIRTYTISHGTKFGDDLEQCYYDVSNINQKYNPNSSNNTYNSAVSETNGLIITIDGKIAQGFYDSSCVYTANQAKSIDPSGSYTNDNYYIRYGAREIDGIHFQQIPIMDVDTLTGKLKYYTEKATENSACFENNGYGISIDGAEYLSTVSKYDWEKIIDYYYQDKAKIMTVDPTYRGTITEGEIYRQGDPAWGSIPLGNSSATMASAGCAVTSIAIGISFSETEINAPSFDAGVFINALNAGNCFTGGGLIIWNCQAITDLAPSVKLVANNRHLGTTNSEKINYINSFPLDKYFVITHYKNNQTYSHYVNFQEFIDSEQYMSRDPGQGKLVAHSIAEIDQVLVYTH